MKREVLTVNQILLIHNQLKIANQALGSIVLLLGANPAVDTDLLYEQMQTAECLKRVTQLFHKEVEKHTPEILAELVRP